MMNTPDPLSSSYTDSISSELHRRMEADEMNHNSQSFHSNLSNLNTGHTIPIGTNRSMLEISDHNGTRRGSTATDGGPSSYYKSIREESDLYSQGDSDDDRDDDKDKITPLPKIQMLIISILLFSEPLTSTILFPFIYSMASIFFKLSST